MLLSAFFEQKLAIFVLSENTDKNCILIHFFLILLTFIESYSFFLIPTFREVTGEKLEQGAFLPLPP